MRPADRPQQPNQHNQGKHGRQRIGQQSNCHIATGQLLGHDARANHRAQQHLRTDEFSRALLPQIRWVHALEVSVVRARAWVCSIKRFSPVAGKFTSNSIRRRIACRVWRKASLLCASSPSPADGSV